VKLTRHERREPATTAVRVTRATRATRAVARPGPRVASAPPDAAGRPTRRVVAAGRPRVAPLRRPLGGAVARPLEAAAPRAAVVPVVRVAALVAVRLRLPAVDARADVADARPALAAPRAVLEVPAGRPAGRPVARRPRPVVADFVADAVEARAVAGFLAAGFLAVVDVVVDRPRRAAPWRWATRYTDDSPIPNRLLISETGVSVSAYRRVTSRSCWSLSLRRVPPAPSLLARDASPLADESDVFTRVSIHLSNLAVY
jgi:hypothetical protein